MIGPSFAPITVDDEDLEVSSHPLAPPSSDVTAITPVTHVRTEEVRRDQTNLLYAPIPKGIDEIDIFFYDANGKILSQR